MKAIATVGERLQLIKDWQCSGLTVSEWSRRNEYTNIIADPDEKHEIASFALRDVGIQFKAFSEKESSDCPEVPEKRELKDVSRGFIGLSNTMYVHKGSDRFRLLEDNEKRVERIKKILGI